MSSLRLALKLSMSEAPASALQSKGSKPNKEFDDFTDLDKLDKIALQKRKRKLSAGGDDSSVTDSVPVGPQKKKSNGDGNEKDRDRDGGK
jgi:hypothetical protein